MRPAVRQSYYSTASGDMHYNILEYWQHLQNLPDGHPDKPGPRVCRLMLEMFELWRNQQPFPEWDSMGHLRDHLDPGEEQLMTLPLAVRRGYAMKKMLQRIAGEWGAEHGFFTVNPDELIVGTMPPYSVGQGKELMDYLKGADDDHDEHLEFEAGFLNPWSNFGHICPNHEKVVRRGLKAIMQECQTLHGAVNDDGDPQNQERRAFYQSVIVALEGVLFFAAAYADRAQEQADIHQALLQQNPGHPKKTIFEARIAGMTAAAQRLRRIPAEPCQTFTDAVQCIYLMNCALHWTGEITSLGRLDQILLPCYERDSLTAEQAQEVIDCLWVKLDERVMLDNRHFADHFTQADGALLGAGGPSNFDQGSLANQWMQQITIGGVKANDSEPAEEGCNQITRMCLHAARRFPFNCPTLDLRIHRNTPDDILELAAQAMLSGGAHPILLNDDKLIPALQQSGEGVDLATARNYSCDGCYETIFPGETEFSFIYIPGVDVLEKALNSGAGFGAAGGSYLRGMKSSYRTPTAAMISNFEQFYQIMEQHIWLNVNRQLSGLFYAYGSKGGVCPTPILSAMIDGCVESGHDLYAGGAKYHMFAPLMTGISTVADSLFVIENLVFDQELFTLEELVACLRSDWGQRGDVIGLKLPVDRVTAIRELCLAQPKFGHGRAEVDQYAWRVINSFVDAIERARQHPMHAAALQNLQEKYSWDKHPFRMLLTPGVGTFEQYVFGGGFAGATPDGRAAAQPIASDLSAAPVPQDIEPILSDAVPGGRDQDPVPGRYVRQSSLAAALSSWSSDAVARLTDGAPSDFNIREDFPQDKLVEVLRAFANGHGSNIMTITTGNPETLRSAEARPQDFHLIRVRMGGWTEFFSVLFDDHKKQHRRRPVYTV